MADKEKEAPVQKETSVKEETKPEKKKTPVKESSKYDGGPIPRK